MKQSVYRRLDVRYSQAKRKTVFSRKRGRYENNCKYALDVPAEHCISPPTPPYFYFRFRRGAPTNPAQPMSMRKNALSTCQWPLKHGRYLTAKGARGVFQQSTIHRHRRRHISISGSAGPGLPDKPRTANVNGKKRRPYK